MPVGTYRVMDGDGNPAGVERFRCAPGPAGWRYVADIERGAAFETVDLAVDALWRPVRLRIETPEHALRAVPEGDRFAITLDGEAVETASGPVADLDYASPCFNAVTANRLGATADVDVVFIEPGTLRPRSVRQRYERLADEPVETAAGTFDATRWRFTDLESGWTRPFWVAGDVVVAYGGLYELIEYQAGAHGAVPRA